jgi:hypothetical protein
MDPAEAIAREADRIVNMILFSDLPWIDIAIMAERLRERVAEEFPDKQELFEHLYARRFERIWSDWRGE